MIIGEPSVSNRLRKLWLAKVPASLSASQIASSASSIERLNGITTWMVKTICTFVGHRGGYVLSFSGGCVFDLVTPLDSTSIQSQDML
jgi:hypothetical protein